MVLIKYFQKTLFLFFSVNCEKNHPVTYIVLILLTYSEFHKDRVL